MAKIDNSDYTKKHGKLNRKDNVIHRVRNGKEHAYSIVDPYQGPASEAQDAHRSNFGKINAIVNRIMADPEQVAEFEQRMNAENKKFSVKGLNKPFGTVRQYAYAVIREQIELTPPPPTQLPKGISLHIRTFADLSASEIYEILKARYAVFTQEQGIIYLDEDNIDYLPRTSTSREDRKSLLTHDSSAAEPKTLSIIQDTASIPTTPSSSSDECSLRSADKDSVADLCTPSSPKHAAKAPKRYDCMPKSRLYPSTNDSASKPSENPSPKPASPTSSWNYPSNL